MITMFRRVLSLLIVLLCIQAYAQDLEPMSEVVKVADAPKLIELYVTHMSLPTKTSYTSGEKYSGTLELYNPGDFAVEDIGAEIFLGTDLNESLFPQHKISVLKNRGIVIKAGEKKQIQFSFDMPSLEISGAIIYVELYTSSGSLAGFYLGRNPMSVTGGSTPIQIDEAYIYSPDTKKSYGLEQGPGIGDKMPNKSLQLILKTEENISGKFDYAIDVFEGSLQGEKVRTISESVNIR